MIFHRYLLAAVSVTLMLSVPTQGLSKEVVNRPWMNTKITTRQRVDLIIAEMTQEEKFSLLYGYFGVDLPEQHYVKPAQALPGSAGWIPGIDRLGIPAQFQTDAGLGVATQNIPNPRERTSLPSGLAIAATFNPSLAKQGGAMIGQEARASGFNVMLAGGANLVREPRNGRNFEYPGEDPLLAGRMVGAQVAGIQSNHIISTLKHFAFNNQETGRKIGNVIIDEAAARTSELMAFHIALTEGKPGSVMCAYNKVNGYYSCENDFLLNRVLKGEWGFNGYVMSDWGGVHSTIPAINNGLDQESAYSFDKAFYFGPSFVEAVANNWIPQARLDDMVKRVLFSMFDKGLFDFPLKPSTPIDFAAHAKVSQQAAEEGLVLLKNQHNILPLDKNLKKIALIGGHADIAVLSGGGSSQVYGQGGNALKNLPLYPFPVVYHPSSPMKAIQAIAKTAQVDFTSGDDQAAAIRLAQAADIAIVFATQWTTESLDVESLLLQKNQNELISAVAKVNPKTLVVLINGGPIFMPWLPEVAAVLEAWYPGTSGGEAIARIVFGDVNPSGHLPVSFPADESQFPQKIIANNSRKDETEPFDIPYAEGAAVGYKWYDRQKYRPLFPFGFGLSYSTFVYSDLNAKWQNEQLHASFSMANTSNIAGKALAQVYASPAKKHWEAEKRLVGWAKTELKANGKKTEKVVIDPMMLAVYDTQTKTWRLDEGDYDLHLMHHAADPAPITKRIHLAARVMDIKGNTLPQK